MTIQSKQDIIALKAIGRIVALTLQAMIDALEEGMTTLELDQIGRKILEQHSARPAPELVYNFPGATCISINEQVAHAIPGKRRIHNGDLVNIDVSAELNGYFADTGGSVPFGNVAPVAKRLCDVTQEALQQALKVAKAGNKMADLQKAINRVAERNGFSVIQNLVGHGIGRHLHEEPRHVPDNSREKDRRRFQKGAVLTLEPFLSTGPRQTKEMPDGWTLVTDAGNFTAQYEHTIIITESEPIILTAYTS
jgi:methionyl aminopeptidase